MASSSPPSSPPPFSDDEDQQPVVDDADDDPVDEDLFGDGPGAVTPDEEEEGEDLMGDDMYQYVGLVLASVPTPRLTARWLQGLPGH
jgi:hypothetical protein